MVKTNRSFKNGTMIIELTIDVGKYPSMISSEDLEECFKQIIGFTSGDMKPKTIIQAFVEACKKWNINFKKEVRK